MLHNISSTIDSNVNENRKIIHLKNLILKNVRNGLKTIINESTLKKLSELMEIRNHSENFEERRKLLAEENKLRSSWKKSICICGYCDKFPEDEELIFHAGWQEWWCQECFNRELEVTNPENWFNKGEIVRDDI